MIQNALDSLTPTVIVIGVALILVFSAAVVGLIYVVGSSLERNGVIGHKADVGDSAVTWHRLFHGASHGPTYETCTRCA